MCCVWPCYNGAKCAVFGRVIMRPSVLGRLALTRNENAVGTADLPDQETMSRTDEFIYSIKLQTKLWFFFISAWNCLTRL